MIVRNRVKG